MLRFEPLRQNLGESPHVFLQRPSHDRDIDVDAPRPAGFGVTLYFQLIESLANQYGGFEHLVVVLSAARPIYWVQAEPRHDPTKPRLRVTACHDGRITGQWPLGHYHPHGEWLEWVATGLPAAA